jgi:D-apiose dehydrogenase
MSTLRGALIGCGYIAQQQLWAWRQIPGVQMVAVCDVDVEKARRRAEAFQIENIFADYRQMMDSLDLDFVDIATRPALHVPMVAQAASRGLHVLCQKPMASTMEEARQMVQVCQEHGVQLMINENYRHQAWFRQIRALLDAGRLGAPHYVRFHGRWRSTLPTPDFEGQDYFSQMPQLIVYEMGIHLYDTARYLFGEATSIYADLRQVSPDIAGEDMALTLARFGDLTFLFDINWFALSPPSSGDTAHGEFVVEGTEGTIQLSKDGSLQLRTAQGTETWTFTEDTIPQSFVATQRHFVDCLRQGQAAETSGAESLKTMALVFGAYRSAREGCVVQL